jgi:hypothetical protein
MDQIWIEKRKLMFIYTNGCSIASGYGLDTNYTKILSEQLNSGYTTDSRPAVGNDWIFHKTLESLININPNPDLVIIQWSSPNRRVHQDFDGKEWYVNTHDHTHLYPKFEPMGSKHTLHYIYCMQEWLVKRGINYLFFDYFGLDLSIQILNVYKEINWDRFIDLKRDFFVQNGLTWDNLGHPNMEGLNYIVNKIGEKLGHNFDLPIKKNKLM